MIKPTAYFYILTMPGTGHVAERRGNLITCQLGAYDQVVAGIKSACEKGERHFEVETLGFSRQLLRQAVRLAMGRRGAKLFRQLKRQSRKSPDARAVA